MTEVKTQRVKKKSKGKQLFGFWNDADGISMKDWLTMFFAAGYMAIAASIAYKMMIGDNLKERDIDFFEVFSWSMMTIIAGYFSDGIASKFSRKGITIKEEKKVQIEKQTYEGEE